MKNSVKVFLPLTTNGVAKPAADFSLLPIDYASKIEMNSWLSEFKNSDENSGQQIQAFLFI